MLSVADTMVIDRQAGRRNVGREELLRNAPGLRIIRRLAGGISRTLGLEDVVPLFLWSEIEDVWRALVTVEARHGIHVEEPGVGGVLPIGEVQVDHAPTTTAASRLSRHGLVSVRIQKRCGLRATNREGRRVDMPLVLIPEDRGILDRIEEMGARRGCICVDFRRPLAIAPGESVESGKKEERTMLSVFCIAIVALATGAASAQQEFKGMPWHLVDIWWDTGEDLPFESYAIDVTIGADVPSSANLYIAPIGLGQLSGTKFYGGIQTQADGHTKQDRRIRKIGPGFLMSMWGQRTLDAIRPALGGLCQSSGHEGDFVSVRRAYEWSKGTYTYRVVRMDREMVEGQPFTWVGAFVYSHERDENVFIGALRFPGENLVLNRKIASFVEVYGRAIPVAHIPKVTVTFGNLRVNGLPAEDSTATAIYPDGVPDYAQVTGADGHLVVEIGEPVEDRVQRTVKVLPAANGG